MPPDLSLALGALVLCLPTWLLRPRGSALGGFDQKRRHGPWVWGLSTLDLFRAAVGAWLITTAAPVSPLVLSFPRLAFWRAELVIALIITLALVVQTLSWRDEDHALAPLPCVLGVLAVVAHPIVIALALPLGIGGALALRAWSAAILGLGVGLAGVGLAVTQQNWRLGVCVGAALCTPVLVSMLSSRHLGWPKK